MNNKKLSIEWHSIVRDLLRNVWIILCAMIMGLMGSYIVTHSLYLPEYKSSASLIVNSAQGKSNAITNLSQSAEIAEIYCEVFTQPTMQEKVCDYIGKPKFDGKIEAFVNSGTNIMEISVTSSTPVNAYRQLAAILKVYPMLTSSLFNNGAVSILKMPSVSKSPSNSMTSMNYISVMLICALVAFVLIVIVSIIRDTVKNANIFVSSVDSKLIGIIPHESKTGGIRDYFIHSKKSLLIYDNAYTSLKFTENFNKIAAKLEYMNKTQGDKVFAVTSVAENEGKSTVASNIAISLATKGYKVILIDLDAKKPALHKIFEFEYEENAELADLLTGKVKQKNYKFRQYKNKSLFIALNTKGYKDYHDWLETGKVKKTLDAMKQNVDYIIVDTAPLSVDASVTEIAKICDNTLVVVRTDSVYISVINDSILTLKKTGADVAGCILNDEYEEVSLFGQLGIDEYGYHSYHRYGKYGKYGYGKYGYGKYGYGKYGKYSYGKYGKYSGYDKYSKYSKYSNYGKYEHYSNYGNYDKYGNYGNYDKYGNYSYGKYGYSTNHANPSVAPEEISLDDIQIFDIKENDNGGSI